MAQARITAVKYMTLPLYFSEQFWKQWTAVMYPETKK